MRAQRLAAFLCVLLAACGRSELPVFEVDQRPFVHKVTAEGTLKARDTTKLSVPQKVRSRVRLAWIAKEGTQLAKGDLVAVFDSKEFEDSLEEARSELSSTEHETRRTEAESDVKLGEYERDFDIADLELDFAQRFQLTDEEIFSRIEILEARIDELLAAAKREHAGDMGQIQKLLARTQLELLMIRSRQASFQIDEARAGLAALEVRAPHDGVLTLSRNWTGDPPAIGAEMWRGQEIGELPAIGIMDAEVFVLEADAGGLERKQRAAVVVESRPEKTHAGTVAWVDTFAKPRFRGSPLQYFGASLELETGDTESMKPGQRVRATIYLNEMKSALVVPRQAVHQRGNRFWVYRRAGRRFEPRDVEIATSSPSLMVVAAGLEEGDVVSLVRPPESLILARQEKERS